MEIYSPLTKPLEGKKAGNEAQSLTKLEVSKNVKIKYKNVEF